MKVPIAIAWFSENEMLDKALREIGLVVVEKTERGVKVIDYISGKATELLWTDCITLTREELERIGFE